MNRQQPEHARADRSDAQGTSTMTTPNAAPFDVDHPPPLDFDAWADLAARLLERHAVERFEILAEREIEPELWDRCETYWADQLACEIGAGDMRRATDYAGRCANELAARQRAKAAPNPRAPS